MTTTSTIPNAALQSSSPSARAYASLVLGLFGLLSCALLSPLAWYLGAAEVKDVRAGIAPSASEPIATIGMVLGIVGSALLAFVAMIVVAIVVVALIVLAIVT